jgi:hypothetical protein
MLYGCVESIPCLFHLLVAADMHPLACAAPFTLCLYDHTLTHSSSVCVPNLSLLLSCDGICDVTNNSSN